jgi:hypothetical protein
MRVRRGNSSIVLEMRNRSRSPLKGQKVLQRMVLGGNDRYKIVYIGFLNRDKTALSY